MSFRNIVTLSDVPLPLHEWYKHEARRRSQEAGKRVGLCTVVVEALEDYKQRRTGCSEPAPAPTREPVEVQHG